MAQQLAPQRVPRPVPRPADLVPLAPAQVDVPEGFGRRGAVEGMYEGLDIQDETADYGALGRGPRRRDPSEIVLHQTDSQTGDSTRDTYAQRIRNGQHTGAHYLIDENGETSLTVPTDQRVDHTVGHNRSSIGIETVGMHRNLSGSNDLHADVGALDLAPGLRERLLGQSPRELRSEMRANNYNIYEDINGPQKRANWNLIRALGADHGLDPAADVHAHEHLQAKTLGEGENTEEFIDRMVSWPGRIEQLEERAAAMRADPSTPLDALKEVGALLNNERANAAAVRVDGTPQESNALEGERILGYTGPASEREARRIDFWDNFHPNMDRLDEALS